MKFFVANIVVVEAGASFNAAATLPVLHQQAAILFASHQIVADFLSRWILHRPVANPEIKLTELSGLARRNVLEELLKFRRVVNLAEFAGVDDKSPQTRPLP